MTLLLHVLLACASPEPHDHGEGAHDHAQERGTHAHAKGHDHGKDHDHMHRDHDGHDDHGYAMHRDHDGHDDHDYAMHRDHDMHHDHDHAVAKADGALEAPLGQHTARLEATEDALDLVVVGTDGAAVAAAGEARVVLTGHGEEAQRVVLTADGDKWSGAARAAGAPGYVAVVSVDVDGATESARFAWGAPAPHHHHGPGAHDHKH